MELTIYILIINGLSSFSLVNRLNLKKLDSYKYKIHSKILLKNKKSSFCIVK